MPAKLAWVNEAARRDKGTRFTALMHHVDVSALERAFRRLKRSAAPGIDGVTVASYEQNLAQHLSQLHARVQSGSYRQQPTISGNAVILPSTGEPHFRTKASTRYVTAVPLGSAGKDRGPELAGTLRRLSVRPIRVVAVRD